MEQKLIFQSWFIFEFPITLIMHIIDTWFIKILVYWCICYNEFAYIPQKYTLIYWMTWLNSCIMMSQYLENNDYSLLRLHSIMVGRCSLQIQACHPGHVSRVCWRVWIYLPLWRQYTNCAPTSVGINHCFEPIGIYINSSDLT